MENAEISLELWQNFLAEAAVAAKARAVANRDREKQARIELVALRRKRQKVVPKKSATQTLYDSELVLCGGEQSVTPEQRDVLWQAARLKADSANGRRRRQRAVFEVIPGWARA